MPIALPYALVPFAGAVVVVLLCLLRKRTAAKDAPQPKSTLWWASIFVIALAFCGAYGCMGLLRTQPEGLVRFTALAVVLSLPVLWREKLMAWIDARRRPVRFVLRVLALCLAALACAATLESTYNVTYYKIEPYYVMLQWLIVLGVMATLYFLGQRRGAAALPAVLLAYVIGLAQYFTYEFKGTAILPGDVTALRTAASVGGNYTYSVGTSALVGLSYGLAAVALLSLVRAPREDGPQPAHAAPRKVLVTRVVTNLSLAVVCGALFVGFVAIPSYSGFMGVRMQEWFAYGYYCEQGFLPCFVLECQKLPIPWPEGYSDQKAQELEAIYAQKYEASTTSSREQAVNQFNQVQPAIIVVMNETFSDLSTYTAMDIDYDGPTYFKNGITDAISKGPLCVSVTGGGTCNTEFEFLTGNSMAYVGPGKYPYNIYQFDNVDNIARQLGALGYKTTAIHPNVAKNWSRNRVYPQLGFDTFLTYDDFKDAPTFHYPKYGVTDKATYDKILELLEQDDSPQFIFDVTMQNHSPYDQGTIPDELLHHFQIDGLSASEEAQIDEYVACMDASDKDLEYFVGKLRELDRPVVLAFFGDHQSICSPAVNDTFYPGEDSLTHNARLYDTVYFMWANYDVAGADQTSTEERIGVDSLAAVLFDRIGAPLTQKEQAQLGARQTLPAFNPYALYDTQGQLEDPATSTTEAGQTFRDMAMVDYLEYGSKA